MLRSSSHSTRMDALWEINSETVTSTELVDELCLCFNAKEETIAINAANAFATLKSNCAQYIPKIISLMQSNDATVVLYSTIALEALTIRFKRGCS